MPLKLCGSKNKADFVKLNNSLKFNKKTVFYNVVLCDIYLERCGIDVIFYNKNALFGPILWITFV